ncbi:uncharacterized [Tachysurus ichikawai]
MQTRTCNFSSVFLGPRCPQWVRVGQVQEEGGVLMQDDQQVTGFSFSIAMNAQDSECPCWLYCERCDAPNVMPLMCHSSL